MGERERQEAVIGASAYQPPDGTTYYNSMMSYAYLHWRAGGSQKYRPCRGLVFIFFILYAYPGNQGVDPPPGIG